MCTCVYVCDCTLWGFMHIWISLNIKVYRPNSQMAVYKSNSNNHGKRYNNFMTTLDIVIMYQYYIGILKQGEDLHKYISCTFFFLFLSPEWPLTATLHIIMTMLELC